MKLVPVLIAGGGPVGMTLACELSRRGIECMLVERNATTTRYPKMDVTDARSIPAMNKFFVIVALAFVIAAQAFTQAANAARKHRRSSAGQQTSTEQQGANCMYQGYPCDEWKRLDRW
jgi:2-polyprenyl-6-methoxyphenol hydroxylase-like FAD-dependent oxidoreductase